MRCDLNCPFKAKNNAHCCKNCRVSKRYLKDTYPDKWNPETGFHRNDGCILDEDRPQECKDYDCKQYKIFLYAVWTGEKWFAPSVIEVPIEKANEAFINKYKALFEDIT